MSPDSISILTGIATSLVFRYVPVIADWYYQPKLDKWRGLIMLWFAAITVVLAYLASCYGLFGVVECSENGLKDLLRSFLYYVASNQSAYLVTPSKKRGVLPLDKTEV